MGVIRPRERIDLVAKTTAASDKPKTKKKIGSPAPSKASGVDIKKLLEAGAHFGHKTSRWHPKMGLYIHSKREGSHIIDLTKTVENLETALAFLSGIAADGKQILLVGTKRQAKNAVKATAEATGMPYVTERWLGGMLTNQNTIGARIRHLKELERRLASGELAAKYSKLEVQRFAEEIAEMNQVYGGIKDMDGRPAALVAVDLITDHIPVKESQKLKIPVVALVDTNVDPSLIDYPVPCNDDATKTIALVLEYVQNAILVGKAKAKPEVKATDKVQPEDKVSAKTTDTDTSKTQEKPVDPGPVRGIG